MTRPGLAPFLDPSSVAVIGASRDPSKVGGSVLANLRAARFAARIDGVLVQPMAPHGVELLPSTIRDPRFGPRVVVGFGGIYVEVLRGHGGVTLSSSRAMRGSRHAR